MNYCAASSWPFSAFSWQAMQWRVQGTASRRLALISLPPNAFSEAAFVDAGQSAVDHVEQLAVVVALAEEEFLVIGTGGAIGDVLRGLIVGGAAVLLIARHHVAQFLAPGFQPFSECVEFLLVHDSFYPRLLAAVKLKPRLTGPHRS